MAEQFFLLHADNTDNRIPLTGTNVSIGRDADCDVSLDDAKVSSRHCNLMWHGDSWRIVDLDSRNGVRVNGRQVSAGRLASGDLIQVGPRRLFFWQDGQPMPTMDPATEEAARLYDESLTASASDRRVEVEGVQGALTSEPAGTGTEADSAPVRDAVVAAAAAAADDDVKLVEEPAEPAETDAEESAAQTGPAKAGTGLEFADDSKELQLTEPGPTPESLAAMKSGPVEMPKPAAAPAATATPARSSTRRRRYGLPQDIARALPVLTFAFGLLMFAGGLLFWLNGQQAAAPANPAADGEPADSELDLLRTRVTSVAAELDQLRDRRAALESELAQPGHEELQARLDRYTEESTALTARLRDVEDRLATLLDRLDQLESSLRQYETSGDGSGN